MKKIIYLFVAFFIVASTQSCKRLGDEDGNLLNNLDANAGGLTGARYLHQEVNSVDTLAEYHYNGKKMVEVLNPKSRTNINYNGELINKLTFYRVVGADSLVYTQFFSYDATAKYITNISEVGTTYLAYKAPTPGAIEKYKSIHNMEYTADNVLQSITTKTGKEIPTFSFEFTSYVKNTFTFDATNKNVLSVTRDSGPFAGGIFGAPAEQRIFAFSEYDEKINPQTLLPFGYKISVMLDNARKYYWISENNPKKVTITTEVSPIPTVLGTSYTYDPQDYALSGFGSNYDYRPF